MQCKIKIQIYTANNNTHPYIYTYTWFSLVTHSYGTHSVFYNKHAVGVNIAGKKCINIFIFIIVQLGIKQNHKWKTDRKTYNRKVRERERERGGEREEEWEREQGESKGEGERKRDRDRDRGREREGGEREGGERDRQTDRQR